MPNNDGLMNPPRIRVSTVRILVRTDRDGYFPIMEFPTMESRGTSNLPDNRLTVTDLGHRFGRRVLFHHIGWTFEPGTTTAVTGSNGSGKSTLVRILAGLMRPAKGSVELTVDGKVVSEEERPLCCGMVAPYLNVYDGFSPRENLQFLASARGMGRSHPAIDAALEQVGLLDRGDDRVATFSSGMVQRVRLACAILSDPPVLLLDEPTATLDMKGVSVVRAITDEAVANGRIVIVATNEPDEADACQFRLDVETFRRAI